MLSLFRRYPGRLFVVFLLNLCSVLLTILVFLLIEPFCKILFHVPMQDLSPVTSFFMNRLLPWLHLDSGALPLFGLLLLALLLYFLKDFFAYASQWVMASMRSHLLMTLRNEVYDKILNLPLGYFTSRQRGDVVSRAVNDTQEVEHTTLASLRSFMTDPVTLLIFLTALFMIDAPLTIFSLLLMLFATGISAQNNLVVKEFKYVERDFTANSGSTIVLDVNDEPCALIKVRTDQHGFTFDPGRLFPVEKTEEQCSSHPLEIYVWVQSGVKSMSIGHPVLGRIYE